MPERRHFAAAGLVPCALIVVQISFTRLISYRLFYHFVFLAVALTLLGLGAAGTFVALRKPRPNLDASILAWLGVFVLLVPVSLVLMANPFALVNEQVLSIKLLGWDAVRYLIWCSVSVVALNFSGGVVLTELFRAFSGQMGALYARDLVGSGAGCLFAVALMKYLSPPLAFLGASAVAALAALPFWLAESRRRRRPSSGGVPVLLGALVALFVAFGPSWLTSFENFRTGPKTPKVSVLKHEWNHIIRTDHVVTPSGGTGVYVLDGEAATQLAVHSPAEASVEPRDPAYRLVKSRPRVGIIGFGGGPQVLDARRAKASRITAIDINPTIGRWVLHEDRELNGGLFTAPELELRIGEGRHLVRSSPEKFDVLVMHAIDTYAATAAGAYALTENFLYTKEAFLDYFAALDSGGILSIRRWLFNPPRENLRLFATALAALEAHGVANPLDHVVMLAPLPHYSDLLPGALRVWGNLMVSPTPFSAERLTTLRAWVATAGHSVLYAPFGREDTQFSRYAKSEDRAAFQAGYPYVITPVSDASPYLFQYFNPLSRTSYAENADWVTSGIHQSSAILLPTSLAIAVLLTLALILGPLVVARLRTKRGGTGAKTTIRPESVLFFSCIGVGYMALEVPLIQVLALYLGHPVYGFSAVLVALLVSSGVGSFIAQRFTPRRDLLCLCIAGILALIEFGLFPLVHRTIGLPDPARFLLALLVVGAAGLPMGFPMALAIRELGKSNPIDVAWAWGVNAAASVVGSTLIMIVMVFFGSYAALGIAVGCYVVAALASSSPRSGEIVTAA